MDQVRIFLLLETATQKAIGANLLTVSLLDSKKNCVTEIPQQTNQLVDRH